MEEKKFQITTTKDQYNTIKAAAKKEGLCFSSYIRRVAFLDASKKLKINEKTEHEKNGKTK